MKEMTEQEEMVLDLLAGWYEFSSERYQAHSGVIYDLYQRYGQHVAHGTLELSAFILDLRSVIINKKILDEKDTQK